MIKRYIAHTGLKEIEYRLPNFKETTALSTDTLLGENIGVSYKSKVILNNLPAVVNAVYNVSNKQYLYASDGKVYSVNASGYDELMTVGEQIPLITEVIVDGQMQTLIVGKDGAAVFKDNVKTDIEIPFGEHIAVCRGRVITALESVISIGGQFDFDTFSVAKGGVIIKIPLSAGEIVGLIEYDSYVLVLCEKSLFKLNADIEYGFTLESLPEKNLRIEKHTVKRVGKAVYFLNNSRLCRYDGGKIGYVQTMLDEVAFKVAGNAAVMDDKYLLSVAVHGNIATYVYDTVSKDESFVSGNFTVLGDGGYACDKENKSLCLFESGASDYNAVWESKPLDFGTQNKKSILRLCVAVGCCATLEIIGDFGSKVFLLKQGYNDKRTNLASREFKFKLTALESGFTAKDLMAEYKIIGG
jgi:hypothetical protein